MRWLPKGGKGFKLSFLHILSVLKSALKLKDLIMNDFSQFTLSVLVQFTKFVKIIW